MRSYIKGWAYRAELGIRLLYKKGFEIGEDFAPLEEYHKSIVYELWVEGIHRHIRNCREVVR